ncbi:MAG TPA: DNA-3-methyladenine glycosylase [Ohtaekwangia sp.]|uniref:DNA-3-methyladenine glycosylase n=1 Tax=Ohtaekwangia sp. TaxID=2066019 RepID=UPI002F92BFE1
MADKEGEGGKYSMKLNKDFYQRTDVVKIARELLGKVLFTNVNGITASGIIVETEAYSWKERGCHAYGARKTQRNAIMFEPGGFAYVYLCYGMHNMFNVVTNKEGVADAILVRAIEPISGLPEMKIRRGNLLNEFQLTSGPGKLTKALGIDRKLNGKSLFENEVWIEDAGKQIASGNIDVTPRIGIDYAGEDARLPWRFTIKGNKWVSK